MKFIELKMMHAYRKLWNLDFDVRSSFRSELLRTTQKVNGRYTVSVVSSDSTTSGHFRVFSCSYNCGGPPQLKHSVDEIQYILTK